jgi:acetyltransferase-like isoleucine patch superfamily enzyme
MPANTTPIFSIAGEAQWITATAANNTGDLTSGTNYLVFTAGTNGSYVQKIRFRHTGANSAAVVARVWINNGSVTTTAANNTLFDEITIAANATFLTNAASINYELPLNFVLPTGYRMYVTIGAAAAGGIACTIIGGDY